ncbi:MAG: hypothetical protein QXT97_01390 [Candidatus Diapherotrites archaeon]
MKDNNLDLPESAKVSFEFLNSLKEQKILDFYLISGFEEKKALEFFKSCPLKDYFDLEKFFYVDQKYLDSKTEIDKQRYVESLSDNKNFIDHYFKQIVLSDFIVNKKVDVKELVLLGNDLLFDAFYTIRFSKVDFVLLSSKVSMRGKAMQKEIGGLNYFSFSKDDFKRVIEWDFPKQNFFELEKFVFDDIAKGILGENFKENLQKSLKQ